MKYSAILLSVIFCFGIFTVSAQNDVSPSPVVIENISNEIKKISKSLEDLNIKLGNFSETFSSNQGLRLTDKQQKLLLAFELLNRAEARLSTLRLLQVQLAEKEATNKRKIAQIDDNLRSENIERTLGGTTDAETVRDNRRRALQTERNDLSQLLNEIQTSLDGTNYEIRQTELFLANIRRRIFPEIEKELSDL